MVGNVNASNQVQKSNLKVDPQTAEQLRPQPRGRATPVVPKKPLEPSLFSQALMERSEVNVARAGQGGLRAKEGTSFDEDLSENTENEDPSLNVQAPNGAGPGKQGSLENAEILEALRNKDQVTKEPSRVVSMATPKIDTVQSVSEKHSGTMKGTVDHTATESSTKFQGVKEPVMQEIFQKSHWKSQAPAIPFNF